MSFGLLDASGQRWIEYDEEYEKMWEDMKKTTAAQKQETKIRDMVRYLYDQAYFFSFILL
jgi:hypothetical protein